MRSNLLRKILFLFLLLDLFSSSFSRKLSPGNILREKFVLSELKRSSSDPSRILSSWNSDNSDRCSWFLISCDSKSRVVSVILRGCDELQGSFLHSPELSSCSGGNGRLGEEISPAVGKLAEIRVLSLAFNDLGGEVPDEIWGFKKLEVIDRQDNSLTVKLPEDFSGLKKIRVLNLGLNRISGEIPSTLLESTKILKDSLSGHTILKLRRLMTVDDGSQNSQNEIGWNSGKNGLYPIEIASIVSASVIVFVLLVLVMLFFYTRKWKGKSQVRIAEAKDIRVFVDIDVPLTYENIVKATGYFSNSNCIGHGGFGSTYRAQVSADTVVAVKRLSVGRFQGVQQFHAEIKTLELVRHPNLVRLIGYHASETEMFLIYNYLPGGNLEDFIKKERSKAALQWRILHKIALDVARALAYLHEECSPKVLHRDIKPSNILLDNSFTAYLSDFGLAKLLGSSQSHVTTGVAGTFGYVAPEYAMTCRVSEKADVYSYGIVLLELISDKKALDPSFSLHENGFNIVSWAHMMLKQGKSKDVFTRGLWESGPSDDLVEVLHLALRCTVESLSTRPTMKQVAQQLKKIRPS